MCIGYLGPRGTFTEQAAIFYGEENERYAYETIEDVLEAVQLGEIKTGVAPIENSTEGIVNATVDSLIFNCSLFIQSQLALPIHHHMMVRDIRFDSITKVLSHPQSLAQCRAWLRHSYPGVEILPVSSNAEAARIVATAEPGWAAIGPAIAAELYGLKVIARSVQDQPDNTTFFVKLSKEGCTKPLAGHKTTLAFSTPNEPGALYRVLDIFSLWDINMTKIISRPMKNRIGEYVFLIDIENYDEKDAEDALTMVRRKSVFYKILGTYPVCAI